MLTQRRQQQAIADLVHGLKISLGFDDLDEPYQTIFEWVEGLSTQDAYHELNRLRLSRDDLASTIDAIFGLDPGDHPEHLSLETIGPTIPQAEWFWEGWVPRGMMSILAAWPGVGKTYVSQYLAHCITNDLPAPDGQQLDIRSGNVIYIDAEGFIPDLYERGRAWQQDMSKLYPVTHPPREVLNLADAKYQDALIDMCYDLRPDLLVIDSLSSVNIRGENNVEDIRGILRFFLELAAEFELAEMLVHHLRKPPSGSNRAITMHDLRGTGHLVAMARAFLGLDLLNTSDPNGPRLLKLLKKNRGKFKKPISIQFSDAPTNPDVALLSFGQMDLFEQPETKVDLCSDWLIKTLGESERSWLELVDLANDSGFSKATLHRAKENLGDFIVNTLGSKVPNNKLALNPDFYEAPDETDKSEADGVSHFQP